MTSNELEYEELDYSISIKNGDIQDEQHFAEEIVVKEKDSNRSILFSFGTDVPFTKEEIKKALIESSINRIFELESGWDVSDPEYTTPREVSQDTNKAKILQTVYRMYPTTNKLLGYEIGIEGVSAYISKLREDGLVEYVGKIDGEVVIVPTHLGIKEVYCLRGKIPNPYKSDKERGGKEESGSEEATSGLVNLAEKAKEGGETEGEEDAA